MWVAVLGWGVRAQTPSSQLHPHFRGDIIVIELVHPEIKKNP